MADPIFHVALAVDDIQAARTFYLDTLGCRERSDTSGADFSVINFHGAQLVLIEAPDQVEPSKADPVLNHTNTLGSSWTGMTGTSSSPNCAPRE